MSTVKKITKVTKKIGNEEYGLQVESAIRDGAGNVINTTYATKAEIPSIPTIPNLEKQETGSGNVVTAIDVSGHKITYTKGITALTSHQTLPTGSADIFDNTNTAASGTIKVHKSISQTAGAIGTAAGSNDVTVYTKEQTDTVIATEIGKMTHITVEVVDSLDQVTTSNIIYLVKQPAGSPVKYKEYLKLSNGTVEEIGDTNIDISGKANKTDPLSATGTSNGHTVTLGGTIQNPTITVTAPAPTVDTNTTYQLGHTDVEVTENSVTKIAHKLTLAAKELGASAFTVQDTVDTGFRFKDTGLTFTE